MKTMVSKVSSPALRDFPVPMGGLPQARVDNANHLFGDVFSTDEEGDPDPYGEVDPYGDVDLMTSYELMSGDLSPEAKARLIKGAKWGAGLATAGVAAYGASKLIKAYKAKAAALKQRNSNYRQQVVRQNIGRTAINKPIAFMGFTGAKLNSAQIDINSKFPADMMKQMLDRSNLDTPFNQETAIGTLAGGIFTCIASGVAGARYYGPLMLKIGSASLVTAPGTTIKITATFPTINGTLTVSDPYILVYEKGFEISAILFPWQLVTNKALAVLGSYNNANPITVAVSGLPTDSAVTLTVPGSLHPWIKTIRNSFIK